MLKRIKLLPLFVPFLSILLSSCGESHYRVIESLDYELIYTERNSYTQGACTDGANWYLMSPTSRISYLRRVNISTGVSELAGDGHGYAHGNGMCYNPKTEKLYIADMDGLGTISVANPETLLYESSINVFTEIGGDVSSIAYNDKSDEYVVVIHDSYDNSNPPSGFTVGTTFTAKYYAILDSEFHLLRKYNLPNNYMINQGIECDDDLIYFTYSNVDRRISDCYDDYIYAYDWYGRMVFGLNLGISGLSEIEALSKIDADHFYGYFNNGAEVADIVLYTVTRESTIVLSR